MIKFLKIWGSYLLKGIWNFLDVGIICGLIRKGIESMFFGLFFCNFFYEFFFLRKFCMFFESKVEYILRLDEGIFSLLERRKGDEGRKMY